MAVKTLSSTTASTISLVNLLASISFSHSWFISFLKENGLVLLFEMVGKTREKLEYVLLAIATITIITIIMLGNDSNYTYYHLSVYLHILYVLGCPKTTITLHS